MYSSERSASRIQVRHHRSMTRELRGISDNRHLIAGLREHRDGAIQQSAAFELEESLVDAHAGALPSCKDEARARKVELRIHDFLPATLFVTVLPKSIGLGQHCTKVTYPATPSQRKIDAAREFRGQSVIMPQKIMDVLMLGRCSHEFAWPRRAANGEYYQVCLQCAAAYQ